ncbi:MAG: DUF327 family protein [Treponema sp.]|uniref:DUF327 family protein n=1 Tax=Treponema sp. TaxID=166 RepID=UPI003FA3085D
MGNQIESSSYAAGIAVQRPLQSKTASSEKDKKRSNKFTEILRSVLPEPQPETEAEFLERIGSMPQEEALTLLQDAVRSAGDTLRTRQNPETILQYKQAVKHFVGYVARKAYTVVKKDQLQRDRTNNLQLRSFTQIVVINEKLDRFASELLYDQKNQLFILERLEEIYGLIIDLIT